MTTIKVASFDPSLNNFGAVLATIHLETLQVEVDRMELFTTKPDKAARKVVRKNSEDLVRARILHHRMLAICGEADFAIAEVPVGSQSARAMASYGICVGVLAACPVALIEVTPTEVKMAGAGTRTASKADMIAWAVSLYPEAGWLTHRCRLTNDNEHLADALAAIFAAMKTEQFGMLRAAVLSQRKSLL